MKNKTYILIFILGFSIFLYPILGNRFSTTGYQIKIQAFNETVDNLDKETLAHEKTKIKEHNDELAISDLNFVDPFAEEKSDAPQGNASYYDALNLGEIIASIEIPRIDVEMPIYHGTSDEVLSKGAGHLENSSLPSDELGTHSVITAHRGLPTSRLFRDLDQLEVGDKFYVRVLDEKIAYKIESVEIVLPDETNWLIMEDDVNKMTLLTCEPYMINTHRMLVIGHKVPMDIIEEKEPINTKNYINYYILLAGSSIPVVGFYLYKKKKIRH